MTNQITIEKHREQISLLQQAVWDLEKAKEKLTLAKCNAFVLGSLDDVIMDVNEELNDVNTLI